jgi:hypothetical protein
MRFTSARSAILSLTGATAVLVGGAMLLLRVTTQTRTTVRPDSRTGHIIMEGVDINSNGPDHPKLPLHLGRPSERQEPFPPDLDSSKRP